MAAASPQYAQSSGGTAPTSPSNPLTPALVIGSVTFLNNEHPAKLAFPLEERQAVHELIGGGRQVQDMGPQPEDVTWSGTFWAAQAAQKVSSLRSMQVAGQPVTVSWYNDQYSVLIAKFTPTWLYEWRCDYEITVTVVADLCGAFTQGTPVGVDSQTLAAYSQAQLLTQTISGATGSVAVTPLDPSVYTNINTLGTQLNQTGPLAQAFPSQIAAITSTINSAQLSLTPYIAGINNLIATYTNAIPTALQTMYYNVQKLQNLLGLISQNAQIGQAPVIVTNGGGTTLYHLASQYLGDPTLAPNLKSVNGLVSSQLPAGVPVQLKIPPLATNGLQ